MKREPTPGPWIAVFNSNYWEVIPEKRDHIDIPFAVGSTCSSSPKDPHNGLQEANARLMAAAPDLLAALEELVVYCGDDYDLLIKANSAIAKAKGTYVTRKFQMTEKNIEWPGWLQSAKDTGHFLHIINGNPYIITSESIHKVKPGEWIVQAADGSLHVKSSQ